MINSVLKDSNGSPVATWENVVTHAYEVSFGGLSIACNLSKDVVYRIKVARKTATSTMYFNVTLYDADGKWYALDGGKVGGDLVFTPTGEPLESLSTLLITCD